MKKIVLRNMSWIFSCIFVVIILLFNKQNGQSVKGETIDEFTWYLLIAWVIGSMLSVVSGIITLIIERVSTLSKFFNAFSALSFTIFLILTFFTKSGEKSLFEISFLEYVTLFFFFGASLTRIMAEAISAWEFSFRIAAASYLKDIWQNEEY